MKNQKLTYKPSISDKIYTVLYKHNLTNVVDELSPIFKEIKKLEDDVFNVKLKFFKDVVDIASNEDKYEIYKIIVDLPIEHQEEYFLFLSEGVSFDIALQKLKFRYKF
ncbi:hypothetical protein [uncultured Chryseobacterium sp.]|uniref:hypothetical protein n=1 Tax=uncultured Chryseobacterium sp. TaxID=259322 RepID=UPI00258DD3CB|nr:hypothetical protein [uncultured Chryseobacterium sp.]